MTTICERLKFIREHERMTQSDFSNKLGIGQSTLAMMEVGKREILDRHIITICSLFKVNETWFRTGIGTPFSDHASNSIQFSSTHPEMSSLDKAIMDAYFSLSEEKKQVLLNYCLQVSENWQKQISKKNMAVARDGSRVEVAEVSPEEEEAALSSLEPEDI